MNNASDSSTLIPAFCALDRLSVPLNYFANDCHEYVICEVGRVLPLSIRANFAGGYSEYLLIISFLDLARSVCRCHDARVDG